MLLNNSPSLEFPALPQRPTLSLPSLSSAPPYSAPRSWPFVGLVWRLPTPFGMPVSSDLSNNDFYFACSTRQRLSFPRVEFLRIKPQSSALEAWTQREVLRLGRKRGCFERGFVGFTEEDGKGGRCVEADRLARLERTC